MEHSPDISKLIQASLRVWVCKTTVARCNIDLNLHLHQRREWGVGAQSTEKPERLLRFAHARRAGMKGVRVGRMGEWAHRALARSRPANPHRLASVKLPFRPLQLHRPLNCWLHCCARRCEAWLARALRRPPHPHPLPPLLHRAGCQRQSGRSRCTAAPLYPLHPLHPLCTSHSAHRGAAARAHGRGLMHGVARWVGRREALRLRTPKMQWMQGPRRSLTAFFPQKKKTLAFVAH